MARVIGIDLGTTNSVVCGDGRRRADGHPQRGRQPADPVGGGDVEVRASGWWARWPSGKAITNPENTIFSIKRFMGRKFNDPEVQRDMKLVPYRVTAAPNGDVQVWMGGRAYSPPEISRDDPAEAEDRRRGLPGREGDARR